MDRKREAEIVMHLVLGRRLSPALRPDEEAEASRLKAEIEARMRRDRRRFGRVRRRELMWIASETAIFAGIFLWGSVSWPLADPGVAGSMPAAILVSVTVAVICQAAMGLNGLYSRKPDIADPDLPNRLLAAMGSAIVMLSIVMFAIPVSALSGMPGLALWKLLALLGLSFLVIWGWRVGFRGSRKPRFDKEGSHSHA